MPRKLYPFKNPINKNLWHSVIAYISVLASSVVGISKTRAPGSKVLWNQRPTCLQCPAVPGQHLNQRQLCSVLVYSDSHPLRTEHITGPRTSTSLPYSRFSLSRKGPWNACVSPGPSSWVLRLLKWPLNLSRAGFLTHSFPSDTFRTDQDNSENSQSPCHYPHWGIPFSHLAKKSHKVTCSSSSNL